MNKVKTITIVCWIITALALTGLVVFFITGTIFGVGVGDRGGNWFFGLNTAGIENLSGPFQVDGNYSVTDANIDSIDIRWVAGEIRVEPHDGNDIRIIESAQRELRDSEKLRYSISGNMLRIDFSESNVLMRTPRKNLEVLVPQALSENMNVLSVSTVSGEISVNNITAAHLDCDSTSARINVSGAFNRADLGNVSGSITLNNLAQNAVVDIDSVSGEANLTGSFDRVEVNTVSGSTVIESTTIPSSLNISGVSGRVDIHIPTGEAVTVNHSSVSGRFNSEIPVAMQSSGAQFNISTVSGNTNILPLG